MVMIAFSKNGITFAEFANAVHQIMALGERRPWLSFRNPTQLATRLRNS